MNMGMKPDRFFLLSTKENKRSQVLYLKTVGKTVRTNTGRQGHTFGKDLKGKRVKRNSFGAISFLEIPFAIV